MLGYDFDDPFGIHPYRLHSLLVLLLDFTLLSGLMLYINMHGLPLPHHDIQAYDHIMGT